MHYPAPKQWAFIATLVLATSTVAFSLSGTLGDTGASSGDDAYASSMASHQAGSAGHNGPYGLDVGNDIEPAHTPPFPLETGAIPTRSDALDFPNRFSRFIAQGTEGLDQLAREGYLSGSGTPQDPYLLERFYVDGDLTIQSTDRAIVLREGYVTGQLSLNYIGEKLYVHHVYAKDLRVNENVARSGDNTGGLFHDNAFGFVGQIRHFVGEFRDNAIGPKPQGIVGSYLSDTGSAQIPAGVVFNFDGFHGADVHDNTFLGQVDIKLHGHNHGDCLQCNIHDHADIQDMPNNRAADGVDTTIDDDLGFRSRHSVRYHSLLFRDNIITVDDGFALRYNDRNHAGDDQTANSEPNEFLEDPHVHYQQISLRGNTLRGGPLVVDIFNAEDDRHVIDNQGVLRITQNTVEIPYVKSTRANQPTLVGMDLRQVDGIGLMVAENQVLFKEGGDDMPLKTLRTVVERAPELIGFRLDTFRGGDITLASNHVNTGSIGVLVRGFADDVYWRLEGNDLRTSQAYRGDGIAHGPGEGPDAEEGP